MSQPEISPSLSIFAPLEKVTQQSDGSVLVNFTVSTEALDDQGEIVDFDAVKKASTDYMQWAALREMHQPSAVGTTVALEIDDDLRKVTGIGHVVDPVAVSKVTSGVYKGVSLGGRKLARAMSKVGGKSVPRITEILWTELSLVDRPSNPDAVLTLAKRSDATEEATVADETTTAAEPATPAAKPVDAIAETPAADAPPAELADAVDGALAEKAAAAPVAAETPVTVAAPAVVEGSNPTDATPDEPTLEQAAKTGDLVKSAADDARDATWILSDINRLIETEAAEGDTAGVTQLKTAQAAMVAFVGTESAEVGTPEDVAQVEAEAPIQVVVVGSVPMYYAAVTGDLAKIAAARATGTAPSDEAIATASQLHDLAVAAGAPCDGPGEDANLQKISTALSERFGTVVRKDELDAAVGQLLGALGPMQEQLAKVAAQPVGGGPLRYADGRFADLRKSLDEGGNVPADLEAEVLSKIAAGETDPSRKALIGEMAAVAATKNVRAAGPSR